MRILRYLIGQELQGNEATELNLLWLIDDTHPTATQLVNDAVMGDGLADHRKEC
jgi:hypothetical protein